MQCNAMQCNVIYAILWWYCCFNFTLCIRTYLETIVFVMLLGASRTGQNFRKKRHRQGNQRDLGVDEGEHFISSEKCTITLK